MTYTRFPILAIFAVAAAAAWAPPALAQAPQQPQPGMQQQPVQPQSIGEEELRSYASAAVQVHQIREVYQPRLQAAGTQAEQQEIEQQALQQMSEAVRAEGLSVDQYNNITRAIQADPQLAKKIQNYVDQEN